jgi:hypothetical protein
MFKNLSASKKWKMVLSGLMILSILSIGLVGCSTGKSTNKAANTGSTTSNQQNTVTNNAGQNAKDTDGDGIPDTVEKTYGTNPYTADTDGDGINDKQDKQPVNTDNPIKETSTEPLTVTIKDARVEDNATADHLEITMINTGKATLNNFDFYYTITDKVDQTKESYYQALNGLSLKAGETRTIHFDNQVSKDGHYYGNMSGLYGNSKNGLTFAIQLHATGFKPLDFKVEKAKGTAEVAD